MKRLISLFLILVLLPALTGCGGETAPAETTAATTEAMTEAVQLAVQETEPVLVLPEKVYKIKPYEPLAPVDPDCGWNQRLLSDEVLEAMWYWDPNVLRNAITTVADAVALLDMRFPELWMDAWLQSPWETTTYHYRSPQAHLGGYVIDEVGDPVLGRSDICNILMCLVEDDLPVGMLYGVWSDKFGFGPNAAANYLRTTEGYLIFDPVLAMQGNEGSLYLGMNLLPEAEVATLEDYIPLASAYCPLWKLYAWEEAQEIDFELDLKSSLCVFTKPALEPLYETLNAYVQPQTTLLAGPEDIHRFQLSEELGGLTLTVAEAKALVDAEPETVKEQVKTAADLLLYMLAAQLTDCGGDLQYGVWHYNLNAFQVMEKKQGNCGSCANLANYLLEGDYEEVGFIQHAYYPGGGGSHIYSYFLYEGSYYIVDYSWYLFSRYNPYDDFPVMKLASLAEYGQRCQELYGDVSLVLAHLSPGQHLPCVFNVPDRKYTLAEDGEFTLLFQSDDPDAFTVNTGKVPSGVPDWKEFGKR